MLIDLSRRSQLLERLDTGAYSVEEYARWKREMWYIHRFFGEIRALRKTLIARILESGVNSCSILDIGAGGGGLLGGVKDRLNSVRLFTVGVELDPAAANTMRGAGINAIRADGVRMPFSNSSFDYVMCSLMLHHLDRELAILLLREIGRVARQGFYVIDLNRALVPYYLYRFAGRILLQRLTVEDGALSIRRAYRREELLEMSKAAGLTDVAVKSSAINRLVLCGTGTNI